MRQRIAAAARELFLRDGVDAVSMRNIAGEVGCSPMALYRYFAGKQEILWQVWDLFFGELFARLERIEAETPRARLEDIALAYLDYWIEHPGRFLIVFLQKDVAPDGTRNYLASSGIVERFDLIARVAADARAQGDLLGAEPDAIARGLLCVMQGLALNLITIPEYPWGDARALGRMTVRSYLAGLRPAAD
ncbi:TetR/AcrR family transcriptional regulator [Zavarzinia aquatilis]|nr:TetR/AcrR family transcriptional regulator [Zavarzinia aquatilis]